MTQERLAFLMGGYPAFELSADLFVTACGGSESRIALLFQNANHEDQHYLEYADPWTKRGAREIALIGRDQSGLFDVAAAIERLDRATGIFIAGGHTPIYHELYGTEPLRSAIHSRYAAGVPFGGISAGAMLAAQKWAMTFEDTGRSVTQPGLGIAGGLVAVHFSEREQLPTALDHMALAGAMTCHGLDESTCAVFRNGELWNVIGSPIHLITMTSTSPRQFAVTRVAVHNADIAHSETGTLQQRHAADLLGGRVMRNASRSDTGQ